MKAVFGLIGYPLSHSFSQAHFTNLFEKEGLKACKYLNFELESLEHIRDLALIHPDLKGLNVTIPHKINILSHLDSLDPIAKKVGAVNCIDINSGKWKGYNTDAQAFQYTLKFWLERMNRPMVKSAIVFGSGGASKAVQWALEKMKIAFKVVSRMNYNNGIAYEDLSNEDIKSAELLINATPVGMGELANTRINFNAEVLHKEQLLYDLIYNPSKTLFLESGILKGCQVNNGLEMLFLQAQMSWHIWNQSIKHT